MPVFTNYTANYFGTLDHLLYDSKRIRLMKLLNTPEVDEVAAKFLPSEKYPSDHVRIEAVF